MKKKKRTTLVVRLRRRGRLNRLRHKPLTEAQIKAAVRRALKPYAAVHCYYRGYDPAVDRQISKLIGRKHNDGSGFAFDAALRDIDFYFATEAKAVAATKKIKAAKLKGVRVFLRTFKEVR